MNGSRPRRVAYIASEHLVRFSSLLPSNRGRSTLVHSLASSLGLFKPDGQYTNLLVTKPRPASVEELCTYHDQDYIDFLMDSTRHYILDTNGEKDLSEDGVLYGLEDDCPPFPGLSQYISLVAGASLTASRILKEDRADIAITWDGGRHHAAKARASGFCYVADCVMGILDLRKSFPRPRVMYIDLDVHFSDGVTEAFAASPSKLPSVLTLSIHHSAPGFFPPSPLSPLTSADTLNPFALSLPLQRGASNATFARIWKSCVEPVKEAFAPDFVVLQCGVDGLAGDPNAIWNWGLDVQSEGSMGWCVDRCLKWECRTLMYGGGGYHSPNAARSWAYLTSIACGSPLSSDTPIPEHKAFPLYAPSFTLEVAPGNMQDQNSSAYLGNLEERFSGLVERLELACNPRNTSLT